MFIQKVPSGPLSTNAYVIGCLSTKQAMVIDPAAQSIKLILDCLRGQELTCIKIILTHSHWDHIVDLYSLLQQLKVPVAIHALEATYLEQPGSDGLPCPFSLSPVKADLLLEEGMSLAMGTFSFLVMHTPGHSPGSICLYEETHQKLFSGDTLFQGSMGNVSFPTSEPSKMWLSLKRLAQLPAATQVYPGHGPFTSLAKEQHWLARAQELFSPL